MMSYSFSRFVLVCMGIGIALVSYMYYKRTADIVPNSEQLKELLQTKPIHHIGIIMDGNRRWAKKHGLKPWIGHKEGVNPVKETITFCMEYGIKHLTLYVFSLENFSRPQAELSYLFDTLAQEIAHKEMDELFAKGIRVRFIGDATQFPPQLISIIKDTEQKTAQNSSLYLNLLFCYGGQQELTAAAHKLCEHYATNTSKKRSITKEILQSYLWSAELPAIDLIIRTAGDQRLSNFLPFQSAYSELYFLRCYWPELTQEHLIEAVHSFVNTKRNFGA